MSCAGFKAKRREILFQIFDKYPNLSNRGTAILLCRDYPEYFSDVESARLYVRIYRGANGEKSRSEIINKQYFR